MNVAAPIKARFTVFAETGKPRLNGRGYERGVLGSSLAAVRHRTRRVTTRASRLLSPFHV